MRALSRRSVLVGGPAVLAAGLVGSGITWDAEHAAAHAEPSTPPTSLAPGEVRGGLSVTWSGSPSSGAVALTFDDGPTEQFTARVLDALATFELKATFFMIGALVERHPDLVRRVRDEGHELANHSYDHHSAAVTAGWQVHDSLVRGADAIERVSGVRPRWYRPPRGEVTSATLLAALAGEQDLALWSVGRGTRVADADVRGVSAHLKSAVGAGDVIDLHDGIGRSSFTGAPDARLVRRRTAELAALPDALKAWTERGLAFTTLSELCPKP